MFAQCRSPSFKQFPVAHGYSKLQSTEAIDWQACLFNSPCTKVRKKLWALWDMEPQNTFLEALATHRKELLKEYMNRKFFENIPIRTDTFCCDMQRAVSGS